MDGDQLPLVAGDRSSNRLTVLAGEIQQAHSDAVAATHTSVERSRDAGQRLIEAKSLVPSRRWLAWLKTAGINERSAQDYMQLARLSVAKAATVADLGLRAALLSLFRQWVEGHHAAAATDKHDDDGFNEALDAVFEIEDQIAATPAQGAGGLAVKVYIAIRYDYGQGRGNDPAAITPVPTFDVSSPHARFVASITRDVAQFVPEATKLIAPFLTTTAQGG